MIYNTSFFKKEFRNAYLQQSFSRKRQLSLGVFLGMITFAAYFCLQTLKKSVLMDAVPYLLLDSYFSTLYIYLFVSLIFNVSLFIANYEYMSFIEVMRNRWYPLVQLGYHPLRLIMTKLIVRVVAQSYIYIIGFITTAFLSSFLKFPLVMSYFGTLLIVGLLDIIVLSVVSLTASLYFRDTLNARYVVGLIGIGIIIAKAVTGFSQIVSDRTRMMDMTMLFDTGESIYVIACVAVSVAGIVLCMVRGNQLARVYNPPLLKELPALKHRQAGTVVLKSEQKSMKKAGKQPKMVEASTERVAIKHWNLPSILTSILLVAAIACMLGVNAVVLACGYASPEKETSIFGTIPYVFQSNTMEPTIMFNDLAYFQKLDIQEPVKKGDMVLFKDPLGTVCVARVTGEEPYQQGTDKSLPVFTVDIDHYIDDKYRGLAEQQVGREQIYGRFSGTNRWLGAIILFANTILGRLILLLIPVFLVFFYDPITKFFKNISAEHEREQSHADQGRAEGKGAA
ncbi:MAG: hypothetical protein RR816_00685 [Clostridia bacterium]